MPHDLAPGLRVAPELALNDDEGTRPVHEQGVQGTGGRRQLAAHGDRVGKGGVDLGRGQRLGVAQQEVA
jgi:hypothetical protein